MKTIKYICGVVIAATTLSLGGCSNDVEISPAAEASLVLDVVGASRSPIYDTTLPDPSIFTIGCINLTGKDYQYEIRDVEYSGGSTYISGKPVMLRNDSTYQVYAMYPRIEDQKGLLSGEININAYDQIDYMNAISEKLTYKNSHATLKFGHMLSLLRLNFRKSDFITDDYNLEALSIGNVALEGTFNLLQPGFVKTFMGGYDVVVGKMLESDKYVAVDVMVLPTNSGTSNLWLVFANDKFMHIDFEHKGFQAGKIHTLNITVSADQLSIAEGDIKPWTTGSSTDISSAIPAPGKAVDLGLSKLWADRNVGAYRPSEYGEYYTYLQSVSVLWGEEWEAPTPDDINELISKCTWSWVNNAGINGYQVSGNGNSIFLPAAGWIYETNWNYNDLNQRGLYSSSEGSVALDFSADAKKVSSNVNTLFIRSLRPVKVKK